MYQESSVVTDVIQGIIVEPNDSTDVTQGIIVEPSDSTDVIQGMIVEPNDSTDVTQRLIVEPSDVTDIAPQTVGGRRVVIDFTQHAVKESSLLTDISIKTVKESSLLTDISMKTVEESSALTDLPKQVVEELSTVTDITQQTVAKPNAVTTLTQKTVAELNAVTDITRKVAVEPNAVTDSTPKPVAEQNAITDITQQNAGEPNAVTDITQQNAGEPNAVTDITQQTIQGESTVTDDSRQTGEKQTDVTNIAQQTTADQSVITGDTQYTLEEQSAVTDLTERTVEEQSAVTDAISQLIEEQNIVKDVTRETTEGRIVNVDVTQQTIKEPSVVRDVTQRKFGYVKVSWEIDNSFFGTSKEEWEISSPVFEVEGFCVTRWRLILKVKKSNEGKNQDAYICLERIDGENDTRSIRVCWSVWYKISGAKLPICDRENLIERNCLLEVAIKDYDLFNLLRHDFFRVGLTTMICLEGLILVRSMENGVAFKRSEDLGVKRLSEDMSIAYSISQNQSDIIEYESFSDLKINTEGYPLICHKPILSARNRVLKDVIDKNRGKSVIDFNFSKGKAGRKIMQYLYSGNLTPILRMPSISIDEAIHYLGIDELKCYYLTDSVNLITRFEAEELIYFKWIAMDLNSSENFLFSPIFSRENSGLALRLRLGLNNDLPKAEYFSLKLDVIEGNKIPEFYFISGIADKDGKINHRRTMQWTSDCNAEIPNFAPKALLRDPSISVSGHLPIVCSVFIPKGTKYESVVKTQKCLRSELDPERHYRLLSVQLNALFETGDHTDLVIECREETFKVHKCVLFARSPILRRAIRNMRDLEGKSSKGFSMNDFPPKILRILLRYIYSGILNCEKEDLLGVYEGSKKLSMVTLQNQLYNILRNNLDVSNAVGTLELAVENADFRLVVSVCRFININMSEIKLKNLETLMEKNESWSEKLKKHTKVYLKGCENV